MNYFKLFNLNFSYSINFKKLINSYKKLQLKYHPDFFIKQNKEKQIKSIEKSAIINMGYLTLKNELLRAEHMLILKKINTNHKKYKIKNLYFLEKNFQLYEELKSIKKEKTLLIFYNHIKKTKKKYIKKIEEELNLNKWNEAGKTLNKLKFIDKIQKKAKNLKIKNLINKFK